MELLIFLGLIIMARRGFHFAQRDQKEGLRLQREMAEDMEHLHKRMYRMENFLQGK